MTTSSDEGQFDLDQDQRRRLLIRERSCVPHDSREEKSPRRD
jgi:hypothetical protein